MSGSEVQVAAEGGAFSAYLAAPAAPKGPAVVILQEIFGVNANIRAITDDYATQGYIAIAPDIFWRQRPGVQLNPGSEEDRNTAMGLLKGLDQARAADDAYLALEVALQQAGANGKTAAVGYCLGGKLAYLLAARRPIDAAVSYYGVAIQDALAEATKIKGALLLHLAGADHLCPPEAQSKIIEAVAPLGARAVVETYDGAGHAFARRGGPSFNEAAATRADALTASFLKNHLGA